MKYKPLPTGSSEIENEPCLEFLTANQNTSVCTDWIPTNVGQWLNRSLVRIESDFFLCIFYLAVFWLVGIGGFPAWVLRAGNIPTQEQGTHRSQPTRTQPNRKCKGKSQTQLEPESVLAIGQHLLESNQCAHKYSDSWLKILSTARSQFHLSLLEIVYISRKKKRFLQGKAVCIYPSTVSIRSDPAVTRQIAFLFTIDWAISLNRISP